MTAFLQAYGLDLLIAAVLGYYLYDGYVRGAVAAALETAGFFLSLLVATALYRFPAALVEERLAIPHSFAAALAFFVLWWTIDLLWPYAARGLRRRLPTGWNVSVWNRRIGPVPGAANAALLLSVFLTVALAFPLPSPYKRAIADARLARPLLVLSERVDAVLKPVLGPLAQASVNLLTVRPESGTTLDLRFTVHDGERDPDAERRMLDLVNAERRERGLTELAWSDDLAEVALAHSRDMFARGYFSHVDPDGRDAQDRVDRAGVRYGVMGENLALAPDLGTAHRGLMDSPGHRANILHADFRRLGVGVIDGGVYGKMFTQLFTN